MEVQIFRLEPIASALGQERQAVGLPVVSSRHSATSAAEEASLVAGIVGARE